MVLAMALMGVASCRTAPHPRARGGSPTEQVKSLLADAYTAIETHEPERLNELLAPDVTAFGLGPKDAFDDRDTLVAALRRQMVPLGLRAERLTVTKSAPHVGLGRTGSSAWFADFLSVDRLQPGKPTETWAVRVSGHAIEQDGVWRIDAIHVSVGYPDADLYNPTVSARLSPPASAGEGRGPGADQIVGLTKRLLDDVELKIARTSPADEVVLIGTDASDVYVGGAKFKAFAESKLPELKKAAFSYRIESGPRARLSADGTTGWVAATVVLRLGSGKRQQTLPAFRVLWVFASEEADRWSMVSEHQSVGLLPGQRLPESDGRSIEPFR